MTLSPTCNQFCSTGTGTEEERHIAYTLYRRADIAEFDILKNKATVGVASVQCMACQDTDWRIVDVAVDEGCRSDCLLRRADIRDIKTNATIIDVHGFKCPACRNLAKAT